MCAALKGTELNMLPIVIRGIVHPKILFVIIYSLTLSQARIRFSLNCLLFILDITYLVYM